MKTLFIDTHDKNVVIIIFNDNKILNIKNICSGSKHSEIAVKTIDEILSDSSIDIKEINNIIVVNGPGSFTGVRIAVTIAKTIAYSLNIPIRVVDSLVINAINLDYENKYVSLEDRNGAYVAEYDLNNNLVNDMVYLNKSDYEKYKKEKDVFSFVNIDYEKVFDYVMNNIKEVNPHSVKPLYVKGISALNDK